MSGSPCTIPTKAYASGDNGRTTVGVPHAVRVVAALDEPFPAHGPGAETLVTVGRNGSPLVVAFDWDAAGKRATNVSLSGQAAVIAIGELTPEALDR